MDKLAKEVFDAYILGKADDKVLKELSDKYHKKTNFLRDLMEEYVELHASDDERSLYYHLKQEKKKKGTRYKQFIDKLLSMSDDEKKSFLFDISKEEVNGYFRNFFEKYHSDDSVEKLKEWVDIFYKDKAKRENSEVYNKYMEIVDLNFKELVNNGYYSFENYSNDFYSRYCNDKFTFNERLRKTFQYLRLHVPDVYNYYKDLMEKNRMLRYDSIKSEIENFIGNISNYDIVDFYIAFKMSLKEFYVLSKDFLSDSNRHLFNRHLGSYLELEKVEYSDEHVLESNYSFNGVVPSQDDKERVMEFMKQNNIPNNYFSKVLDKYVNGKLSIKCK